MRLKMKNRSYRYDISRPRLGHGHRYTKYKYDKYKMSLSITMVIYIKQHLSNIAQFMNELSNTEAELKKKNVIYSVYIR